MKRIAWLMALLIFSCFVAQAAEAPYDTSANAAAQVQQALAQARQNHKPVLLFFGANWCEDCRSLAASLKTPANAQLMARDFNVVKIDVGNFDHNLDVVKRYGDPIAKGIPAAVLVAPDDRVLYSTKGGELSNARTMSADGVHDFFEDVWRKHAHAP